MYVLKIKDLRPGMRRVNVTGRIVEIGEAVEVMTRNGPAIVASAILEDDTSRIKLSLWNEQISQVKVGDTVKIENGYVSTFRGQKQLNVGFYGKITVIKEE